MHLIRSCKTFSVVLMTSASRVFKAVLGRTRENPIRDFRKRGLRMLIYGYYIYIYMVQYGL